MALMNWSKSCSSGALVAVIGIREYLWINTVVTITNSTCSRTKPPTQTSVLLVIHSSPTLQRNELRDKPIIFKGGGSWAILKGMNCVPRLKIVRNFFGGQ